MQAVFRLRHLLLADALDGSVRHALQYRLLAYIGTPSALLVVVDQVTACVCDSIANSTLDHGWRDAELVFGP
jgi:hypothetical protein